MPEGEPIDASTWKAPLPSRAHRVRMFVAVELLPLALAIAGVVVVVRAHGVTRLGVALFVVMYVLTMLGVELGLHRLVAHRQFAAPPWLRALLCALGSMAGEGSPLLWSAVHRLHHRDPDGPDDVHSPTHGRASWLDRARGLVWSQSLWYGEVPGILVFRRVFAGKLDAHASPATAQAATFARVVEDWRADRVVLTMERAYFACLVAGFALPALVGLVVAGRAGALDGLVWGGLVRFVAVQKASFAVNSIGHTIGARWFDTPDTSRNNVVMAALTLGSGWHNNHHAFPGSASLWFAPWHVDPCYALIRALELAGVVTDVRRVDASISAARRASATQSRPAPP